MKFLQNRDDYTDDSMFSYEQMALIIRMLNVQAFGVEDPPLCHGNVLQIRSSTAQAWKNNLMMWDKIARQGNPT